MSWTSEHMRDLFDFLRWGDVQMLDAASGLADEEYYKERNISAGSLHKLLVHTMAAESAWLLRWEGKRVDRLEDHEQYPTRQALAIRWPIVHLALSQFLDNQTAQSLAKPLTFQAPTGEIVTAPLGEFLFHVVDHGSYHRGQLNTMIKQASGKPVTLGYRNFLASRTNKKKVP